MWEQLKSKAVLAFRILVEAGRRYGPERVTRMAAAISYRMIFAIAPLMLIAVWVFGLVIGDDGVARREIMDRIAGFAGEQIAEAVETFVMSAVTGGEAAAIVGFALLLWTSSSLFMEVQNNLNDIFEVPYDHTAGAVSFVAKRGLGFLWTLGLGFLVLVFWGLNLVWGMFEGFFESQGLAVTYEVLRRVGPLVSLVVLPILFALVLQSLTRVRVPARALYFGSIFTSVVFVLSTFGIRMYFEFDEDTSASQVAGALFVILLATFILSSVFLFGALVTRVYSRYLNTGEIGDDRRQEPAPQVADPESSVPLAAVLGFLGGLFVGWRKRR